MAKAKTAMQLMAEWLQINMYFENIAVHAKVTELLKIEKEQLDNEYLKGYDKATETVLKVFDQC